MNIFKLLKQLHHELKTFNENYPEYLSTIKREKKLDQEDFLRKLKTLEFRFDEHFEKLKWDLMPIKKYYGLLAEEEILHRQREKVGGKAVCGNAEREAV